MLVISIIIAVIIIAYLLLVCVHRQYKVGSVSVYNWPCNGLEWFVKCRFKDGHSLTREFKKKKQATAFATKVKNAHYVI